MFSSKLSLVFFMICFALWPPHASGQNVRAVWDKNSKSVGVHGHSETWDYRIDKLNKKGKSEAFLFVPDRAEPDDLTVIVWFHGCSGYSNRTFDTRLALQLKRLDSSNHSYALVVPELSWSKNTTTPCGRQGKSFRKPGELIKFLNGSLSRINAFFVSKNKSKAINPRIVFIGHSAGGSVIKAAAISGDMCKIKPTDVVWSDSTYGRWFDTAWRHCLSRGEINVVVLIRKWTKTWKSFRSFSKKSEPSIFLDVKYYGGKIYHKTIGDNAIQFAEVFPEGC